MEASLDTILACSIMIVLVLGSMSGVLAAVHPYLQNQLSQNEAEVEGKLAELLLIDPGDPSNWGSSTDRQPLRFGLAESGSTTPFKLDIDKIARLNPDNAYHMNFTDVLRILKFQDKTLKISLKPLLDVSLALNSRTEEENRTKYGFEVYTKKSGFPISTDLCCYTVLGDYVTNATVTTSDSGVGSLEVEVPNSLNGIALVVALARAHVEPRIVSYSVFSFKHNSMNTPSPLGTFLRLSPLNYTLSVELLYPLENVSGAKVFTYNYYFNLSKITDSPKLKEYSIPVLLDTSPMVLVVSGRNGSTSFVEWVTHPPLPLDFGSDFMEKNDPMNFLDLHYSVTIGSGLYDCEIILGKGDA